MQNLNDLQEQLNNFVASFGKDPEAIEMTLNQLQLFTELIRPISLYPNEAPLVNGYEYNGIPIKLTLPPKNLTVM